MEHAACADAPARRDCGKRLEDEAATMKLRVRNGQLARPETAAAPQRDVEIEDARSPAAARPAAECAFHLLELRQHLGRVEVAFDQRDRIGEVAAGRSVCRVDDDR